MSIGISEERESGGEWRGVEPSFAGPTIRYAYGEVQGNLAATGGINKISVPGEKFRLRAAQAGLQADFAA